ncbi:unnamed protein product, partial [Closterium sp. NIES-54]
ATSGRRFLVFAYSLEQLSNTRAHLVEAARFAQATNRTLVLPKGSRSRLSLARDLPLCAYFDLSRLDAHWISPEFFLHLARAAVNPPFAKASPSVAFVHLQTSQVWRLTFTQGPLANMLSELMVYGMGHAPSRRNTVDVTTPVNSSALFQQLHTWWHRDVLVWVKTTYDRVDFHLPTDDISFKMLPYSQTWHAMAHQAMARLPPRYIAVHYRSEFIAFHLAHKLVRRGFKVEAGVLEELMTGCMEAARDLINGMKRRHNISAVFIAADVPFDDKAGSLVRSDSWKDTTWMFQGQKRVLEAPREKLRWLREQVAGTVMVDELMPAVNHYDPGIVAILDKLLCVHAHVFLAGSITCGGSRGFEQDITQHRSQFNKSLPHRWVSRTDKLLWQSNGSSAGVRPLPYLRLCYCVLLPRTARSLRVCPDLPCYRALLCCRVPCAAVTRCAAAARCLATARPPCTALPPRSLPCHHALPYLRERTLPAHRLRGARAPPTAACAQPTAARALSCRPRAALPSACSLVPPARGLLPPVLRPLPHSCRPLQLARRPLSPARRPRPPAGRPWPPACGPLPPARRPRPRERRPLLPARRPLLHRCRPLPPVRRPLHPAHHPLPPARCLLATLCAWLPATSYHPLLSRTVYCHAAMCRPLLS